MAKKKRSQCFLEKFLLKILPVLFTWNEPERKPIWCFSFPRKPHA